MNEELKYQLALTQVHGIGPVLAKKLVQELGAASEIFSTKKSTLEKIDGVGSVKAESIAQFADFALIENELKFIEKHNIQCIFLNDTQYPSRLKQCVDSPIVLFYKGNANLNETKIISIVGTRKNTDYGKKIVEQLLLELSNQKLLVVSGLAMGIDIIAHKNALKNNLPTVGVLAHGLDRIYPAQHRNIAKEMVENGGLLTEYFSNTNPDRENFPTRNRIVAGLADVTIVVETSEKGGSIITANIANNYNRDVAAFPGRNTDTQSLGCNNLIKSLKANLISSSTDLLELMNWDNKPIVKQKQKALFIELTEFEDVLYNIIESKAQVSIDEILSQSTLSSSQIAGALLSLEMQNLIQVMPGKMYKVV